MRRIVGLFFRIFSNGFRFAAVNRDVRPAAVWSCIEYWQLAFKKLRGAHDPNTPIHILGMKVYTFSLGTLLFLIDEIFLRREYAFEPDTNEPLIIDCGSNIGISILFFKKLLPRARIIGFEPDEKAFQLLSRNVTENGLSDVTLHNAAVSSKTGELTFFSNSESPGSLVMSVVKNRISGSEARQVRCVALSTFLQGRVDLLKMDIEGAEMDVMQELTSSGALENVNAMVIEYHHHLRPGEDRLSEMLHVLEEHSFGYDVGAKMSEPGKFQDILLRVYRTASYPPSELDRPEATRFASPQRVAKRAT